jgi:hypothetical protein
VQSSKQLDVGIEPAISTAQFGGYNYLYVGNLEILAVDQRNSSHQLHLCIACVLPHCVLPLFVLVEWPCMAMDIVGTIMYVTECEQYECVRLPMYCTDSHVRMQCLVACKHSKHTWFGKQLHSNCFAL